MKVGDALGVFIQTGDGASFEVSSAVIEHIEADEATIVIPATRVVMAVKHSLDNRPAETDHVFGGLVEPVGDGGSDAADSANAAAPQPLEAKTTMGVDIGEGIHNKALDSSALDD